MTRSAALVACGGRERELAELPLPLPLDELVPGAGPWEVELGFGKGRYLLARAAAEPRRRFLGIEVASRYYRLARERAARAGAGNVLLLRGEALYLAAVALPGAFAGALHAYFPDPWPKARHHKRRLFDEESVDLLLRLLVPGGRIYFATDHLEYGAVVRDLLGRHPDLAVAERRVPWGDGPRTNYEAKYLAQGRPIVRLEAELGREGGALLHPAGEAGVIAAVHEAAPASR